MKRIYIIITLLYVLFIQAISGQEKKWTLEDCITYAVKNNIAIQRQKLLTQSRQADLLASRMSPSSKSGCSITTSAS